MANLVPRRFTRSVSTLQKAAPFRATKAIFDPSNGQGVGWRTGFSGPSNGSKLPRVNSLLDVFAGTDQNCGWVYACVDKIASEMAGYPWQTVENWMQPTEKEVPAPDDLHQLILEPSEENTYADWIYLVTADLELIGNSYWLKDRRDAEGKPAELLRLHPQLLQIVTDKADRKIGYVYSVAGIQLPLTLDQVMHYRYPSPSISHYGQGTLEGIVRAVDGELAQSAHVTGFFRQGTHLSGVLTVPETLGNDEFERLKKQYQEEFAAATNSFRVLIAEGSAEYKTISVTPHAAGVIDLRKLSKDEILSGFHMPAKLLGGIESSGDLEQDMLVFGRSIAPKAGRISVRTSLSLTGKWNALGWKLLPEQAEPRSMKIKRGRELLGAGGSLNDSRKEAGLAEVNTPGANEPLVPGGLMPLSQVMLRSTTPRPQDKPNLGPDQPHLVGAGDPSGGQLPTRAAQMLEAGKTPNEIAELLGPEYGYNVDALRHTLENLGMAGLRELLDGSKTLALPSGEKNYEAPNLPSGFEDWSTWTVKHADPNEAQTAITRKARFLLVAVPDMQSSMQAFFLEQRRAVLARFKNSRSTAPRVKGQAYEGKAPSLDETWNDDVEKERLESLMHAAVERLGKETPLPWETSPDAAAIREDILSHAEGINATTKKLLREQIEIGVKRSYSVSQIANGNPDENYQGIAGVFDDATTGRAGTIARTETATLYNLSDLDAMADLNLADDVEVLDGNGDPECADADGSVWPIAEARARALGHPNCVRSFVAIPRKA